MGLDIKAYSNLTFVGKHSDDWCEEEDHVQAYAYKEFPQSFSGIPILGALHGGAFLDGGCYAMTGETQTHSFGAGSYTGYNVWRSELQEQFNPDCVPGEPFFELIWFADNEGTIGPAAAAALLADFRELSAEYSPKGEYGKYSREKYDDWTRACELAARNGLIDFH